MEKKSHYSEVIEWRNLAVDEKDRILLSNLNPIQLLMSIFELCINNFDENNLSKKHPQLYNCLLTLYQANRIIPLSDSLEENISTLSELLKIFNASKDLIRTDDYNLYYALLYFIDFLKTHEGKNIFYKIKI